MTREEMKEAFKPGARIVRLESSEPVKIKGEFEVVRVGLSRPRGRKADRPRRLGVYIRKVGSSSKGVWWPVTRLAPPPDTE